MMKTRAEMEALYGSVPFGATKVWTLHSSSRSVRYRTDDDGETWNVVSVTWAAERARREMEAVEMADIQRELK